ncbi:MAG: Insertion element protein [Deltaproteobacteria bacterium]|nr:Insertion element protein [Deltaproteobacteria bacterium]
MLKNEVTGVNTKGELKCPRCGSDALYKYGRSHSGKGRFLCLSCNRQFVGSPSRKPPKERPICPKCGEKMHVFMRHPDATRFRCSQYPYCRTFIKIPKEDG